MKRGLAWRGFMIGLIIGALSGAFGAAAQEQAVEPMFDSVEIETAPLSAEERALTQSRAYYMSAAYNLYRGDTRGARDAIDRSIQLAEESGGAAALLYAYGGKIYMRAQNFRRSTELCRKALDIDPNCAAAYFVLGGVNFQSGRHQNALEMFQKAADADPTHEAALNMVGRLARAFGKNDQALKALEMLTHLRPLEARYRMGLGEIYTDREQYALAVQEYERAAQLNSNMPAPRESLGALHEFMGNLDAAAEQYEAAFKLYPDARYLERLGNVYDQQNRMDKKIETYERIVEMDPDSIMARLMLGESCLQAGMNDKALTHIREALRLNPKHADAHTLLGQYHLVASDDPEKALESYTTALQHNKNSMSALFGLAMTYGRMGDLDNAALTLQNILKIDPENSNSVYELAMIYADNGVSLKDAAERIRGAIESGTGAPTQLKPNDLNTIGYVFIEKGLHLDDAVDMIQKALEAEPANPMYLDSLGWAYYQQNRYEEAAVYLKRAADGEPTNAEILDHLGDVYLKIDRAEDAVASWKSALQIDPGNAKIEAKVRKHAKDESSERPSDEE